MKQILFVDLDRTLFDTEKFKNDFWGYLGKKYHFDGKTASNMVYENEIINDELIFGLERHLQAFIPNTSQRQIMEEVRPQLARSYLYHDAMECLKWSSQSREVRILTFGQDPYQHFKFSFCKVLQDLPFTVVDEPKRNYIAREYPGEHGWLVDDKPDQHLPVGFKEIWLKRDDPRAIQQKNGIIVVNSLRHVLEVL